jgi:hypothetical protein
VLAQSLRDPIGLCFKTAAFTIVPLAAAKLFTSAAVMTPLVSGVLSADVNNFETGISCIREEGASLVNKRLGSLLVYSSPWPSKNIRVTRGKVALGVAIRQ